jgi:hypothetical protein
MAVLDDLRRLSQLDSCFLGWQAGNPGNPIFQNATAACGWYKGRLQQANDGSWIFRSISSDGTVVGFQLGSPSGAWSSSETPSQGIAIIIPIVVAMGAGPQQILIATVFLQQQLPQELTN